MNNAFITKEQVEAVLTQVRPLILRDGGDVELIKIEDQVVYIRLLGACTTCPISQFTVKFGIEEELKKVMPAITVKAVS